MALLPGSALHSTPSATRLSYDLLRCDAMIYALIITVIAGLALLSIPTAIVVAGRRLRKRGLAVSGWSIRPNAVGFTIIAIVVAFTLGRVFPEVLFLPLVLPFFWRFRGGRRSGAGVPFAWQWRARREPP